MKITVYDEVGEKVDLQDEPSKSLMQAIRDAGLNIAAQCGGEASCGTCHVYISEDWSSKVNPPSDTEEAMLDFVDERRENSRLSCQIALTDELDGLEVTLAPGSAF